MNNWKTTATGVVTALIIILPIALHCLNEGRWPDQTETNALIAALGLAGIGYHAKDARPSPNVANGTIGSGIVKAFLLALVPVFFFAACTTTGNGTGLAAIFQSDLQKAKNWLNSSAGQAVVGDINGALSTAIQIAGGKNAAKETGALQLVDATVTAVSNGQAPSAGSIAASIQALGGSSTTANLLAPKISNAVQQALTAGLSPSAASTAAATAVQTAATSAAAAVAQPNP